MDGQLSYAIFEGDDALLESVLPNLSKEQLCEEHDSLKRLFRSLKRIRKRAFFDPYFDRIMPALQNVEDESSLKSALASTQLYTHTANLKLLNLFSKFANETPQKYNPNEEIDETEFLRFARSISNPDRRSGILNEIRNFISALYDWSAYYWTNVTEDKLTMPPSLTVCPCQTILYAP